jgi:hypothetical protein
MRKGLIAIPLSFVMVMALVGMTEGPRDLLKTIYSIYTGYIVLYGIYLFIQYKRIYGKRRDENEL